MVMCITVHVILTIYGLIRLQLIGATNADDRCPSHLARNLYMRTHADRCYQFVFTEKQWSSASGYCGQQGGALITIERPDIQEFVERSLADVTWGGTRLWIGATDSQQEQHWKWVTGQNVSAGYSNWKTGSPSCHVPPVMCQEDCACLLREEGYLWYETFCSANAYQYGFICQYEMIPETTDPTTSTTTSTAAATTTTAAATTTTTTTGRNITANLTTSTISGVSNVPYGDKAENGRAWRLAFVSAFVSGFIGTAIVVLVIVVIIKRHKWSYSLVRKCRRRAEFEVQSHSTSKMLPEDQEQIEETGSTSTRAPVQATTDVQLHVLDIGVHQQSHVSSRLPLMTSVHFDQDEHRHDPIRRSFTI